MPNLVEKIEMMKIARIFLGLSMITVIASCTSNQSGTEPWTASQLMDPTDLAAILNNPAAKKPALLSIGFGGSITGSKEMGPAKDEANVERLRNELKDVPKDADIVIFCGCCPFADCPNVRPAFKALNEMKFTNHKLLNLTTNLKKDWIDKGYPMQNQ